MITRLDGTYIARGDECFPGLVPREAPSTLTAVDVSWNAAAQLSLGVEAVVPFDLQVARDFCARHPLAIYMEIAICRLCRREVNVIGKLCAKLTNP